MNNQRRSIVKMAGLSAMLSLLPTILLATFTSRRDSSSANSVKYINRVLVHIPDDKSVAIANSELKIWAKSELYTQTVERFKTEGSLVDYSISRNQNPFIVQLNFSSLETREKLIHELTALQVFDDAERLSLGYTMSEEILTMAADGAVAATQTIRIHG